MNDCIVSIPLSQILKRSQPNNPDKHTCPTCANWRPEKGEYSAYGACIICKRTDITGNTCYLQTHRSSGIYCNNHIPTTK
ncbi:MAG: hypothetical protein RR506_08540 [Akkermansia sp.]